MRASGLRFATFTIKLRSRSQGQDRTVPIQLAQYPNYRNKRLASAEFRPAKLIVTNLSRKARHEIAPHARNTYCHFQRAYFRTKQQVDNQSNRWYVGDKHANRQAH